MFWLPLLLAPEIATTPLLTTAERSEYQRTSTTAEVRGFMAQLQRKNATLRAYSPKGAPTATESGKPLNAWRIPATGPEPLRIYINANTHGGEVEGKEALQIVVRELLSGLYPDVRRHLELVVMPCYNAEGTDALDTNIRRHQPNPQSGVGRRETDRGLDLNRDLMKAQTQNTRWLLRMLAEFDPHVVFDLHTTNGSYHGFHLTYGPALTLGADEGLLAFNRHLLVQVREALKTQGVPTYDFGNFLPEERSATTPPERWQTFDFRPRYLSNYPALRNRLAILSEAYVYRSFAERIEATRRFVLANLAWLADHKSEVKAQLKAAEARSTKISSLPLGTDPKEVERYTFDVIEPLKDDKGRVIGEKSRKRSELPAYVGFIAKNYVRLPQGYLVDAAYVDRVRPVLDAHGVRYLPGSKRATGSLLHFHETARKLSPKAYQGIFTLDLEGLFQLEPPNVPAMPAWSNEALDSAIYVPLDQPLARVAFYLLDPRSPDGLVYWGFFHESLLRSGFGEPTRFPIVAIGGASGASSSEPRNFSSPRERAE